MKHCKKCGRIISKTKEHVCATSVWNKGKKGVQVAWNKGKQFSVETKKKLSDTRKRLYNEGKLDRMTGNKNPMFGRKAWNSGTKGVQIAWNKGKKMAKESRLKLSGSNHYNWKGGLCSINTKIRKIFEYRQWVQDIFKRDNYICQGCGERGVKLNVHHIKPFALILAENNISTVEEALNCSIIWDYDNGITLCVPCHKKTDTYLNVRIKKITKKK